MAIRDMFDREIQQGDVIIITTPKVHTLQVLNIEEPSSLVPQGQMPMGKMTLSITFDQPIPNPQRSANLRFSDICIVKKFVEFEAPEGTSKQ